MEQLPPGDDPLRPERGKVELGSAQQTQPVLLQAAELVDGGESGNLECHESVPQTPTATKVFPTKGPVRQAGRTHMSELVVMQFDGQDGSRTPAIRPRCWCNSGSSNPVACRWAPRRIVHGLVTNVRRRRSQSAAGVCHPRRAGADDSRAAPLIRPGQSHRSDPVQFPKPYHPGLQKGSSIASEKGVNLGT